MLFFLVFCLFGFIFAKFITFNCQKITSTFISFQNTVKYLDNFKLYKPANNLKYFKEKNSKFMLLAKV